MSASLIARQLTVTRGALTVLSNVDLTLAPGHRIGVVGPNGIGKSTLLQALAGQITDHTSAVEGSVE
ncbi:MAG: ATPase subunit of ABC transporter with duplicated ATPase domains, partial [Ilumatobacter sp.]